MDTLIYRRTHTGDPNALGVFGCHGCMGRVRRRHFDAVIGVGGKRPGRGHEGIAFKITWVGINPSKTESPRESRGPLVEFERFVLWDEAGPDVQTVAPKLFKYMCEDRHVRHVTLSSQRYAGRGFDNAQARRRSSRRSAPPKRTFIAGAVGAMSSRSNKADVEVQAWSMKVALIRIGIDTGSGGIHGPLFQDGSFDYVPIPDGFGGGGVDERTYGNTTSVKGRKLVEYFPPARRAQMANRSIHFDPEFATFTYGDPTPPKAGLRRLEQGDMLIFYCGLQGWDFDSEPALYLMGYFEVLAVGKPDDFGDTELQRLFANNFHVRHAQVLGRQRADLVLVKGSEESRLLKRAVCISVLGQNRLGQPLKVLSPEMQETFGAFNGRLSFQRSPTRWVDPAYVGRAMAFMRSLP